MPSDAPEDKTNEYERLLRERKDHRYSLRLYVTGLTVQSVEAIDNIKGICENELQGRYDLEVIDISKRPDLAKEADIFAAPTLIKVLPTPLRRLIGDLSDTQRVLLSLDLKEKPDAQADLS